MDDRTAHEDLDAFVIGALDARERTSFEGHLASCDSCARGVASYGEVMEGLHRIATPPAPPVPQLPMRSLLRVRSRAFVAGTLAAAACAMIVVGAATPAYQRDRAQTQRYAAIALMLATVPREVALVGSDGVTGRAIVGDGRRQSGFIVRGLAPAPAGYVYRVWVRGGVTRTSPGVLERTGNDLEVLVTPGDALARATSVHVMLESASIDGRLPRREMLSGTIG